MSRRNSLSKGFTLLEILIALFIFTIVAIIMTHALHIIFASQAGTEKRAQRLSELQMANLLLSRDIEQMIDRPIINGKSQQEPSLKGTLTEVTLTHGGEANPTGEALRSTLQRGGYSFQKNSLGRVVWPVLDQVQATTSRQRVILEGIVDGHFDYLDEKGFFHSNWPPVEETKSPTLPVAIRITLKLAGWGEFSQIYIIPAKTGAPPHA